MLKNLLEVLLPPVSTIKQRKAWMYLKPSLYFSLLTLLSTYLLRFQPTSTNGGPTSKSLKHFS